MSQENFGAQGQLPYAALVGRVLQQRRADLNLHQNFVASALGITQSAYSRLESGDIVLSLSQLRLAASVMQTTAPQILMAADQLGNFLQQQGVQITDDKKDNSAAVLIGLGLLAAAVVALSSS